MPAGETSVAAKLRRLIATGLLKPDRAQTDAAAALDALRETLEKPRAFRARGKTRGLYLWGGVGRGKTMLMDAFFDSVVLEKKRRAHFNEFMDEMHAATAALRAADRKQAKGARDPVLAIARPVAREAELLCLDEFQVTDIADAMLLGRFFDRLFAAGTVLVATSNTAPGDLYANGLNRELVLPFIAALKAHCEILHLDASKDYRVEKLGGRKVFFHGPGAREKLDALWRDLGGEGAAPGAIDLFGRAFRIPAEVLGAMRINFAELCEAPLGPRDYLRLARRYHTFLIDDVPTLGTARPDATRRFTLLIDTLYDRHARLAASFAAPLAELAAPATAPELARTLSRLGEMASARWFAATAPVA